MPENNAYVVFDLRELHGHNPDSKGPIKNWLIANRVRLSQVIVVVPQAATIIKMITAVVGLAAGVKILVRDDLAEEVIVPGARMD